MRSALLLCVVLPACSNPPSAPAACPPAAAAPPAATSALLPSSSVPALPASIAIAAPSASAPAHPLPPVALFDEAPGPGFLPRAEPAEVGLDRGRLEEVIREAESNGSDSLLVVKSGRLVAERTFGTPRAPIETMSITKSVVSLAVGMLIGDGKIASLDAPLSTWYPEWKDGKRSRVTLRHVMTHTTGIEKRKGKQFRLYPDRLQRARSAPIADEPGKVFSYSNESTQLLAGIVKSACGKPIDVYLQERLFAPLGITGWSWDKDKSGSVQTWYGLALTARDLAKLGMLMLADGRWDGKPIVAASYVKQATSPAIESAPLYGLLWWLRFDGTVRVMGAEHRDALRAAGFPSDKLLALLDKPIASDEAWFLEAGALLDSAERAALLDAKHKGLSLYGTRPGKQTGYQADGWLGQKLGVYPEAKMVAVRQHRRRDGSEEENQKSGFATFHKMMEAAVIPAR